MKPNHLLVLSVFAIAITPASAQTISAADAKNHVGDRARVCGKVSSEKTATNAKGAPTFINLDTPYPNQIFTIVIWGEDLENIGTLPRDGARLCASGVIQNYHGVPEITVRGLTQLSQ
jgi:hypothetical protein